MIVQLTRFVFSTAGALAGLAVSSLTDWPEALAFPESLVIILFIILGGSIGFIIGGIIGRELTFAFERVESHLSSVAASDIFLGAIGLVFGLIVAVLVSVPLRLLQPQWLAFLAIVLVFGTSASAGVRIALLNSSAFRRMFQRLDPAHVAPVAASSGHEAVPKYLDTSAVIDGRFVELLRSGFLEGSVRVPRFVVAELQTLADSADDRKRARGRRGLDMLANMRSAERGIDLFDADYPEMPAVDDKLVRLTADTGGMLVTVDYNLTKVARVQGVAVLNVNELAGALRPNVLPGESLRPHIVREGKEADQGVGYLEDGTMIVVQGGRPHIGSDVDAEVTSVLQTSAGRMIFARLKVS